MKASEVVKKLEKIISDYGDEEVYVSQDVRYHVPTYQVKNCWYCFDESHHIQILF